MTEWLNNSESASSVQSKQAPH